MGEIAVKLDEHERNMLRYLLRREASRRQKEMELRRFTPEPGRVNVNAVPRKLGPAA
jgi:hypothetical protein